MTQFESLCRRQGWGREREREREKRIDHQTNFAFLLKVSSTRSRSLAEKERRWRRKDDRMVKEGGSEREKKCDHHQYGTESRPHWLRFENGREKDRKRMVCSIVCSMTGTLRHPEIQSRSLVSFLPISWLAFLNSETSLHYFSLPHSLQIFLSRRVLSFFISLSICIPLWDHSKNRIKMYMETDGPNLLVQ